MKSNVTVRTVAEWYRIVKSYVEKNSNANFAHRIWNTLNERHPESGISFVSVFGEKKWEHASRYILRLYANANEDNTILQFKIDADKKGNLKLSDSVLIDEVGAETLRLTIDGTDILPSVEENKCTQMRVPTSDENPELEKNKQTALRLREQIRKKVCYLARRADYVGEFLLDTLRYDDDIRAIDEDASRNTYIRVDNACRLIDFDFGNVTMTLVQRERENCDEPYWRVSPNIEVYNEKNHQIVVMNIGE